MFKNQGTSQPEASKQKLTAGELDKSVYEGELDKSVYEELQELDCALLATVVGGASGGDKDKYSPGSSPNEFLYFDSSIGITIVMNCPPGTVFHPQLNVCVIPEAYDG